MNFSLIYLSHSDQINIRLYDYEILIPNFRRENLIMNAEDLTCSICLGFVLNIYLLKMGKRKYFILFYMIWTILYSLNDGALCAYHFKC